MSYVIVSMFLMLFRGNQPSGLFLLFITIMKSLKDYALNITEQEYHDLPAWNHSKIVKYAKEGFAALATINDPVKPSPEMEFGSLFDSLITSDNTLDKYAVLDVVPPPAEKAVLDKIAETSNVPFDLLNEAAIKSAIEECGYQKRWNYSTQYEHLQVYSNYYDIRISGKKIVSSADWKDANEMKDAFYANEYIRNLFGKGEKDDDVEYFFQLKFKVDCLNLETDRVTPLKIMPDLIVVNHRDKTIPVTVPKILQEVTVKQFLGTQGEPENRNIVKNT